MKKFERVQALLKQYDELIRLLKSEGALLNHIRPYHLLSLNDLNFSFKLLPREEQNLVHPSALKLTQQRFNYISADAWCTLFYQVIKIYNLSKINYKHFRTIPGMPLSEKSNLPDSYVNGSNVYSQYEGVLLRWVEVHYELQHPNQLQSQSMRLMNFESDFRD